MQKVKLRFKIKNLSKFVIISFGFALCTLHFALFAQAQNCPATDFDCQIAELQREYDARKEAHEKNKSDLEAYKKQLGTIQTRLKLLDQKLKETEKELFQREVDLGVQEELLSVRLREMYKRERGMDLLTILFSSGSVAEFNQGLGLRRRAALQDWQIVNSLSEQILKLNKDKESLKKSQIASANLKEQISKQIDFLTEEVEKTEAFFAKIKAKQAELLALKAGGFSTSVGDVPPADDPASRPDFNPGFSPAFAAFSFGAPHRKGMSQYGAYGRAKAGQSAEQILKAYYGEGIEIKKDYPTNINITVQGYGTVDLETYVKRIYEMPNSWGDDGFEALKAQAVAARSYALAYTNNGTGSICATEACQVYKPANKGGKWEEAVNATKGWVLMANGKPFSAWYASTAGGYVFSYTYNGYTTPGFWDTPSGRDGWTNQAYEKQAGSPWFYKAWYKTRSGASYGRSHPWLNMEEFTDIINALLIYKGNKDLVVYLSSLDAGIPQTWSMGKVREEAGKYGGPVTNIVGEPQVVYANDGYTARICFETDKGRKEFTGEEFKYMFNLRAPGAISIKSSLFNIMRK